MRLLAGLLSFLVLVAGAAAAAAGSPVFRRADGSQIAIPGAVLVWCDASALHVASLGTIHQSRWELTAARGDVRPKHSVRLLWEKSGPIELFVYDAKTRNEASSETEGTRGRVTFGKAACTRGSAIELHIDATLGSEFGDGTPIKVTGTFVGRVSSRPTGH